MITKIDVESKITMVVLAEKLNELVDAFNKSQDRRGPKSEREMTDADARRILPTGDLASSSHKDAAEALGLSYAQVYSCRKEFTFKHIHKELATKLKASQPA